ncbi:unnamed protein product [Lepeophtheirus salmonis]|uniref:(salmon louse) hypothetical protein n=1 Tax=Lepeophtheirus salmonis TaxID=72036 RepID=A0A7R8CM40_LEPSM|nr:unnamed protein product [Lepeophtheirus salmonis]CAF2861675.1 unnamed protein product [Lepeophtheirus salmonis]
MANRRESMTTEERNVERRNDRIAKKGKPCRLSVEDWEDENRNTLSGSRRLRSGRNRVVEIVDSTDFDKALHGLGDSYVGNINGGEGSKVFDFCSALLFLNEKCNIFCCHEGSTSLPPIVTPEELKVLNSRPSFPNQIRNNSFAMASLSLKEVDPPSDWNSYIYVLLFPCGEDGWTPGSQSRDRKQNSTPTLSIVDFYWNRIQVPRREFNVIKRSKRLFLMYLIDSWARRFYKKCYEDTVALVREDGRPDLFLSFTCNPNWVEIVESLRVGESASFIDRPDVCARVFHRKHEELHDDILKRNVLGKVDAYIESTEWQKPDLPHTNILIWLDAPDKPVVNTIFAVKYITKGQDIIRVAVSKEKSHQHGGVADILEAQPSPDWTVGGPNPSVDRLTDEIQEYQDGRYISLDEAAWKILGFKIFWNYPKVDLFPVHLPGGEILMISNEGPIDYSSLWTSRFCWCDKKWVKRKRGELNGESGCIDAKTVSRIPMGRAELYHLRLLLVSKKINAEGRTKKHKGSLVSTPARDDRKFLSPRFEKLILKKNNHTNTIQPCRAASSLCGVGALLEGKKKPKVATIVGEYLIACGSDPNTHDFSTNDQIPVKESSSLSAIGLGVSQPSLFELSGDHCGQRWVSWLDEFLMYNSFFGEASAEKKVIGAMSEAYSPEELVLFKRYRLSEIKQAQGEPIDDFVTRLRGQAKFRKFTCKSCSSSFEDEIILEGDFIGRDLWRLRPSMLVRWSEKTIFFTRVQGAKISNQKDFQKVDAQVSSS